MVLVSRQFEFSLYPIRIEIVWLFMIVYCFFRKHIELYVEIMFICVELFWLCIDFVVNSYGRVLILIHFEVISYWVRVVFYWFCVCFKIPRQAWGNHPRWLPQVVTSSLLGDFKTHAKPIKKQQKQNIGNICRKNLLSNLSYVFSCVYYFVV